MLQNGSVDVISKTLWVVCVYVYVCGLYVWMYCGCRRKVGRSWLGFCSMISCCWLSHKDRLVLLCPSLSSTLKLRHSSKCIAM